MASRAKLVNWTPALGDLLWLMLDGVDNYVATGKWLAERGVKPVYQVHVRGFEVAYLIEREQAAKLLGLE